MITASGRPTLLAMRDPSMVGEARRAASAAAGRLGFDETGRGRVAIVATEVATNLCKYAQEGELLIQGVDFGDVGLVEILGLDKGPGMADLAGCRADGYSTSGSPGTGLGAMARLSTEFDVHTLPGAGTVVVARLLSGPLPAGLSMEFGAVSLPLAGEEVCGDQWAILEVEGRTRVLIADGLGHGPQAAEAAREAVQIFAESTAWGLPEIIQAAHAALRSTRGAALAIAEIDPGRGEVRYAGVGNIVGVVLGPEEERSASLLSHNGTVGHILRKVQELSYPWRPGCLLVMNSDGLGTHRLQGRYGDLAASHPALVAGTLFRDFRRTRDDATVVAVRERGGGPP